MRQLVGSGITAVLGLSICIKPMQGITASAAFPSGGFKLGFKGSMLSNQIPLEDTRKNRRELEVDCRGMIRSLLEKALSHASRFDMRYPISSLHTGVAFDSKGVFFHSCHFLRYIIMCDHVSVRIKCLATAAAKKVETSDISQP
jgi:hypothetical protein